MSLRNWSCCYYCFLLLLLSDAATLVENNDKNDTNDSLCIQDEGNLLRRVQRRLLSAVMWAFSPRAHCCSFLFSGPINALQPVSLFFRFLWSLYLAQPLILLFSFFYVNHNVFFAHSLSVLSQLFTKTHPPLSHLLSLNLRLF